MIQATLAVPFETVDALDEFLLEWGDPRWMLVQDLPTRSASLVGVFETKEQALEVWEPLSTCPHLPRGGRPALVPLRDEDWRDSYKAHFKASQFGQLHWVPVWERETYRVPSGHAVLWLDPGLAFGTGNHETTRLCCERLVELSSRYTRTTPVIDAGCGSGILALSAAVLGFENISAFDNDEEAIRVSCENAALNGLGGRVRFFTGDLVTGLEEAAGGIVLANIQADVLMRFARELIQAVAPGGALVLSGILAIERDKVLEHFRLHAPEWTVESRLMGEWADVFLVRP